MAISIYKKQQKQDIIDKAHAIYTQGFSTREVAKILAQKGIKVSFSTIARGLKRKLSTPETLRHIATGTII